MSMTKHKKTKPNQKELFYFHTRAKSWLLYKVIFAGFFWPSFGILCNVEKLTFATFCH